MEGQAEAIKSQAGVSGEERILNAAEELFACHGFDAVSMQQVAARAGVSKANIFHHFKGKQELYLAVLERACARSVGMLDALGQPSCINARPLRDFARAHLDQLFEHADISRLILREVMDGDPERGQLMAGRVFGEHFKRLVALVRRGQEEGVLRPDMEAADAAACIVGLNVFLFQAWPVLRHLPESMFDEPRRTGKRWQRLLLLGLANADNGGGRRS